MSGEDATNTAVCHATKETHPWAITSPGIHELNGFRANDNPDNKDGLPDHPENELLPTKELE